MQSQVQGMVARPSGALAGYDPAGYFCEFAHCAAESAHGRLIRTRLDALGLAELTHRARAAEAELYNQGITFTIYSDGDAIDRILPFDVIPRLITAADWAVIEAGVRQRVQTLNLFLADVYGPQKVLKDGLVPPELVLGNANYRAEMQGLALPHGTYVHINGTDLVRDGAGPLPGARGQWPLAVGRVLRGREPPPDAARVLRPDEGRAGAAGLRLWPPAAREAVRGGAARACSTRRWCCSRPACSTRPISSTSSSPARWACRWSRAATSWSRTTGSTCAPSPGPCRST